MAHSYKNTAKWGKETAAKRYSLGGSDGLSPIPNIMSDFVKGKSDEDKKSTDASKEDSSSNDPFKLDAIGKMLGIRSGSINLGGPLAGAVGLGDALKIKTKRGGKVKK